MVASWRPRKIVDLATGTGDLALAVQKKLPDAEVTGVDFVPEMLELARRKGVRRNNPRRCHEAAIPRRFV